MMNGHGDDAYHYPPGQIRLNLSSNILLDTPHQGLIEHLAQQLHHIGHYPEVDAHSLEQALALHLGITPQQVMVTSGATEAIYLIAQAHRHSHSTILGPTFAEYADACRLHRHHITHISQWPDHIQTHLMWLCCPNNPTGTVTPRQDILQLAQEHPHSLVIVDQSYEHYTPQPLLSPTDTPQNVLLLHSMTKEYAIPGLRLGYVTGHPHLLQPLRALRQPWSINQIAIDAAHYLLRHHQDYRIDLSSLMTERHRVAQALEQTGLVDTHPSDTHILLCHLRQGSACQLKHLLALQEGILIRDASNFHGLTPAHFRIAVQLDQAKNDAFIAAFERQLPALANTL